MSEFIVIILKVVIPFLVIFNLIPFLIWLERKGSAFIQDRPGPNRANIFGVRAGGLVHSLADVVKLLFKEDIIPNHVNKVFYIIAPIISLTVACITFVVIPFADTINVDNTFFSFQASNISAGILYILAMTSLGVYGIMLAGWSSNNKYALLGALRSSAQMISYELSMGLAIVSIVLRVGSLNLQDIVLHQSASPWLWNFLLDPLAWIIFVVSAFAETNRAPFDLPESESELVAGYHIEYSSIKFAMFFMAEYANMIIASALIITLFFGGWQVPFFSSDELRQNASHILQNLLWGVSLFSILAGGLLVKKFKRGHYGDSRDFEVLVFGVPALVVGVILLALLLIQPAFVTNLLDLSYFASHVFVAILQILTFILKTLIMCWVFIWVRWTLPRMRYDHLMNLGWKIMLPFAMVNVVITALRVLF